MAKPVTVEGVEEVASQLAPREQLRLVAHLSARLSETAFASESTAANGQQSYSARVLEFLDLCRTRPAQQVGDADSAADIRALRDEKASTTANPGTFAATRRNG